MITVKIEDKDVQVSPEQLQLTDGYALITPDSIPNGFLKQEAVDRIVSERVNQAKTKAVESFVADEKNHESILNRYGVTLKDGKALGIEGANIDEIKRDLTLKVRSELENEYKPARGENKVLRERVVRTELETSALKSGVKKELVSTIVKAYSEDFGIDKDGNVFAKDGSGFKINGAGEYVTPQKWFEENRKSDTFKSFFDTSAQGGSGASGQGGQSVYGNVKSKSDLKTVTDKVNFITEHGQEAFLNLK